MLKQVFVTLDTADDKLFSAYVDESVRWNGWLCPYFTREEAERVVDALKVGVYDAERDAFVVHDEDGQPFETFERTALTADDGSALYAVGAYSWSWSEVRP